MNERGNLDEMNRCCRTLGICVAMGLAGTALGAAGGALAAKLLKLRETAGVIHGALFGGTFSFITKVWSSCLPNDSGWRLKFCTGAMGVANGFGITEAVLTAAGIAVSPPQLIVIAGIVSTISFGSFFVARKVYIYWQDVEQRQMPIAVYSELHDDAYHPHGRLFGDSL